jgi:hypothetical protein
MNRQLLGIALLLIGVAVTGCATHQGDFTVASSKIIRLNDFKLDQKVNAKNVEGKDVQHVIIVFPTGGAPSFKRAMDEALEKGDGDVMTDVRIDSWWFYIPYIYGQAGWSVSGDVVKTRRN